jgi:hypothetical protein
MRASLRLAGFILLLLFAFFAKRLPNFAFVFLRLKRFLISKGAPHLADELTTRPFLGPDVHRTPFLIDFPDLRQTMRFSTTMVSVISYNLIQLFIQLAVFN